MKTLKSIFAVLLVIGMAFSIVSCSNDDDGTTNPNPTDGNGKLTIHFDNKYDAMGGMDLELNKVYTTESGDSITIAGMRYWVSNIVLYNGSEVAYTDADSYYLIENTADNEREMIVLDEVPAGTYTKLEFAIGVDSVNNDTLGSGKGELSLSSEVFWSWSTGLNS